MNIHEYQAKAILKSFGVPVPRGVMAESVDEAVAACAELGGERWVVKAQIHAGGRGKAGGVRLCRSVDEVRAAAAELLGKPLVTHQTGSAGKLVRRLYVEEELEIASEFYCSLLLDREVEAVSFVLSPDGGMDIESVAAVSPERILSFACGREENHREMAAFLGLDAEHQEGFAALVDSLYRAFVENDASLIELNPLVLTGKGELLALDAKMSVDDNALFRHPELAGLRDADEEDPREIEAAAHGLNYIALDGNIGCMVNGAGLAMATMDIIQLKGEKPANFLDVGGGVTVDAVCEAFKLLFSDDQVKAVLVNIFGGIVRCDIIAEGLLEALKAHPMPNGLEIPVIMRLVGTNEEEGRRLIREAGLDVSWAGDLDEAASLAAAAAA